MYHIIIILSSSYHHHMIIRSSSYHHHYHILSSFSICLCVSYHHHPIIIISSSYHYSIIVVAARLHFWDSFSSPFLLSLAYHIICVKQSDSFGFLGSLEVFSQYESDTTESILLDKIGAHDEFSSSFLVIFPTVNMDRCSGQLIMVLWEASSSYHHHIIIISLLDHHHISIITISSHRSVLIWSLFAVIKRLSIATDHQYHISPRHFLHSHIFVHLLLI